MPLSIERFRVVYYVDLLSSRPTFDVYDPGLDSAGGLVFAHRIAGLTVSAADESQPVAVIRGGYVRGLGSSDMTGWEPTAGDLLWCGSAGKPTTTRPTTGPQVRVGTYLGSGVVAVEVGVLPDLGGLSWVTRETPADLDVLVFDSVTGQWVPRQLVHGEDLAGLDEDDHPQYVNRRWAWFLG